MADSDRAAVHDRVFRVERRPKFQKCKRLRSEPLVQFVVNIRHVMPDRSGAVFAASTGAMPNTFGSLPDTARDTVRARRSPVSAFSDPTNIAAARSLSANEPFGATVVAARNSGLRRTSDSTVESALTLSLRVDAVWRLPNVGWGLV